MMISLFHKDKEGGIINGMEDKNICEWQYAYTKDDKAT